MAKSADYQGRSRLMRLLRAAPAALLTLCSAGGGLMAFAVGQKSDAVGQHLRLWDAGVAMLSTGVVLFCGLLWGAVYLQVVEAARGMPGLRPAAEPALAPESAARWEGLKDALSVLGFRLDEWFALDDFDETHVAAWSHAGHPAAFVLYVPAGGTFRLRFVRRVAGGGILVTSTRLTDLSYPPPAGVYLQARKAASAEDLWAWHREAEAILPTGPPEHDSRPAAPRDLYVEVAARWAGHRRRDRTWLLGVEPVEECWRLFWLTGMPVRRQFERGWATPFWR